MSRHEEDAFNECDFCGNLWLTCTCEEPMTGFRDEDSSYGKYDLETIQENSQWVVRIYLNGEFMGKTTRSKRKEALEAAKTLIDTGKSCG